MSRSFKYFLLSFSFRPCLQWWLLSNIYMSTGSSSLDHQPSWDLSLSLSWLSVPYPVVDLDHPPPQEIQLPPSGLLSPSPHSLHSIRLPVFVSTVCYPFVDHSHGQVLLLGWWQRWHGSCFNSTTLSQQQSGHTMLRCDQWSARGNCWGQGGVLYWVLGVNDVRPIGPLRQTSIQSLDPKTCCGCKPTC